VVLRDATIRLHPFAAQSDREHVQSATLVLQLDVVLVERHLVAHRNAITLPHQSAAQLAQELVNSAMYAFREAAVRKARLHAARITVTTRQPNGAVPLELVHKQIPAVLTSAAKA
jgi:hypothetical protein